MTGSGGKSDSFLASHFTLKHRAVAAVSRLFDGMTYTARHGLISGMRRKGGLGWLPAWLPGMDVLSEEQRYLQQLRYDGMVVYDVGGFQGLLTLFFAARARQVVVYEPVPANRARLLENLALNNVRNVTVRDAAVGAELGEASLTLDPRMMAAGTGDSRLTEQITSTSSRYSVCVVPLVTIDADIRANALPAPDLVKIDVEGMELAVLQGMRATVAARRPRVYIEMHGATQDAKEANARAVVAELWSQGYRILTHVESGAAIAPENATRAATGHLSVS